MVKSANKKVSRRRSSAGISTPSKRRLTLEGLEARRLLAGGSDVGQRTVTLARNVGTVPAFIAIESEPLGRVGVNDIKSTAQALPLGTGPGQQDTIDLTGSLSLVDVAGRVPEDVDWFSFDLRAGDILDISVVGGVGEFDVFFESALPYQRGDYWFGGDVNFAGGSPLTTPYPFESPLQTVGTSLGAQVVPQSGRYFLRMATNGLSGSYTTGLRVYRPNLESEPIGTQQILFLDFDGAIYSRSELTPIDPLTGLPMTGTARLSPLSSFLDDWQILPEDEDRVIDAIIAKMEENFLESLPINAANGSYGDNGIPGQFGLQILNSRDHADPFGLPNVSRVIIGGTVAESGVGTIGLASSIDVGNFDTTESSFVLLDQVLPFIDPIPRAGGVSRVEQFATFIGNVAAHEAGHFFGAWHQDNANARLSLMDQGGDFEAFTEVGLDGIFGTADDTDIDFIYDVFSPVEAIMIGTEDSANTIAWGLSTGTVGAAVTGRVFNDLNANGQSTGDPGLSGVRVFNDVNGNGLLDSSEQSTLSGSDGTFSLSVAAGQTTIRAITPVNTVATTPVVQSVTAGQTATIQFGFHQTRSDITGTKFADLNGNGTREAAEPGIGGVFVYLDLDGDDRPDLGEPRAITAADGTYNINFPGPGTYTIREVVEAGFIQTSPVGGEHVVVYNGVALDGNFNFGNLPARDYGDAPTGYPVTSSENGANHGIIVGLSLGSNVDRELDGTHSAGADADDLSGVPQSDGTIRDDEDGVRTLTPLAPGATGTLEVIATNSTGDLAYLQGWVDFNRDGDWNDAGERIFTNQLLANGTFELPISVPASATSGDVVARFRYSPTRDLGPTGSADAGEVEDHILAIQVSAEIVNDDVFTVSRNTVANPLDVLANDFQLPGTTLEISRLNTSVTRGVATLAGNNRTIFYTPPNGFVGLDQLTYFVDTPNGEVSGTVLINVSFQTAQPIALDDSYEVPQGSVNQPLNVLDNDVASINGGLTIGSFGQGSAGGRVDMVGGGQSLRYTPAIGFSGTEQFSYSVVDSLGQSSTAEVTINVLPGARVDDQVSFSFELRDPVDNRIIDNVSVGEEFLLSVLVDDVRDLPFQAEEGVASAFLDLLYTDELVATVPVQGAENGFPFAITFGPLFTGDSGTFQLGDAQTPGLLNEIGGTQPLGSGPNGNGQNHTGAAVLFTVRMQAVSAGVATFQADPADLPVSEVLVLGSDVAVPVNGLRLGRTELLIVDAPNSGQATKAVDDSFPDGLDSNGTAILSGSNVVLDVLENDLLGSTGQVVEFGLLTAPTLGTATINQAGTPTDATDDFIDYRANVGAVGVDRFSYVIVTADGFRSTAQVSLAVGAAAANDVVAIDFRYVDESGAPLTQIEVGDRFGVQIYLDDLRGPQQATEFGVFAGYLDLLYDRTLITPTNQLGTDFGFDVIFDQSFNAEAAVGTLSAPGLINEFGTLQRDSQGSAQPLGTDSELMATVFFRADRAGELRVVGDKADFSPFQDTLLYDPPGRVDPSLIRYDVERINIRTATGESPLQNASNPLDVNADGFVSPIDALGVINTLNQMTRSGVQGEAAAANPSLYVDVNGDAEVTPFDVLHVINYLNQKAREGRASGEGAPMIASSPQSSATATTDEAISSFSNEADARVTASTPSSYSPATAAIVAPIETIGEQHDEDDDDILNLLADDVANVWR